MVCRVHTLLRGFFIFLEGWGFVNASGATARVGAEVFAHVGFGRVCEGESQQAHPLRKPGECYDARFPSGLRASRERAPQWFATEFAGESQNPHPLKPKGAAPGKNLRGTQEANGQKKSACFVRNDGVAGIAG